MIILSKYREIDQLGTVNKKITKKIYSNQILYTLEFFIFEGLIHEIKSSNFYNIVFLNIVYENIDTFCF